MLRNDANFVFSLLTRCEALFGQLIKLEENRNYRNDS